MRPFVPTALSSSFAASLVASLALAACGSSSSPASPADAGAVDATAPADDAQSGADAAPPVGYPAPHPAAPTVLSSGGPVMTAPKIVAITFAGDSLASQIGAFVTAFGKAQKYWAGATAEYGVGPLGAVTALTLDEAPPANLADGDVQTWLTAKIDGVAPDGGAPDAGTDAGGPFPQPDANTLYAIFYPHGVTVTLDGAPSCSSFDGYHSDFALSGKGSVSYAVMTRCPPQVPGLSDIDSLAATTSHEFIEAATDPLPQDHPAYDHPDKDHMAWYYGGGGGEIGDICAPFPDSFYKPSDLPFLVQKVWSNKAAAAGHDPCQPDGASPYFNSAPVLDDTITVNDPMAGTFTTKGVKIPVGQSATVELDLYSDAATSGPWKVEVIDVASAFYGGKPELSFSLDQAQGQNGDKLQLTITALKAGQGGASAFWIQNTLGSTHTVWLGLVGN